jgi:chromosome segregation ATPase
MFSQYCLDVVVRSCSDYTSASECSTDTKHEVKKCEDVIEQLTQELSTSQEDLSVAQARIRENEENIRNLRDRVQDLTAEVSISYS